MLSKATFDIDLSNNPIVKLDTIISDDVRDKIAKRFVQALGHESSWCEILPTTETTWTIYPITPEELRKQAEYMIARADEIEKRKKK